MRHSQRRELRQPGLRQVLLNRNALHLRRCLAQLGCEGLVPLQLSSPTAGSFEQSIQIKTQLLIG